jgi:hypothetical protein
MSGFPRAEHGAIDGHAMRATSSLFRRTTSQPRSFLARLDMARVPGALPHLKLGQAANSRLVSERPRALTNQIEMVQIKRCGARTSTRPSGPQRRCARHHPPPRRRTAPRLVGVLEDPPRDPWTRPHRHGWGQRCRRLCHLYRGEAKLRHRAAADTRAAGARPLRHRPCHRGRPVAAPFVALKAQGCQGFLCGL